MSEKSKIRRAKRDARQEKQANLVITWIFAALILFALLFVIIYMVQQMYSVAFQQAIKRIIIRGIMST